jgi:hypothetical protein
MQPVEPGHGAACIRVADGTNLLAQPEALS